MSTDSPITSPQTAPAALPDQVQSKGADSREDTRSEAASSFDIPRPSLTLAQAAAILGKSVPALERSVRGKWGNRLPEGWSARKIRTGKAEEWRIVPPPGFRLRQSVGEPESEAGESAPESFSPDYEVSLPSTSVRRWRPEKQHSLDQPAIVIDRSEEVEHLLRELLASQKALAEERRLHMEDIRMVAQLQGSMRLLESNVTDNVRLRSELDSARAELEQVKRQYNEVIALPWWKRLFCRL